MYRSTWDTRTETSVHVSRKTTEKEKGMKSAWALFLWMLTTFFFFSCTKPSRAAQAVLNHYLNESIFNNKLIHPLRKHRRAKIISTEWWPTAQETHLVQHELRDSKADLALLCCATDWASISLWTGKKKSVFSLIYRLHAFLWDDKMHLVDEINSKAPGSWAETCFSPSQRGWWREGYEVFSRRQWCITLI